MTEIRIASRLAAQWSAHTKEWGSCAKCNLCQDATTHVLARGSIPADILFIGEAPGHSEDQLGFPMIGPSGKLLDKIIEESMSFDGKRYGKRYSYCISNIVACIPLNADSDGGVRPPTEEEALACRPRLDELIGMLPKEIGGIASSVKGIVRLGKTAQQLFDLRHGAYAEVPYLDLPHPAYLLRKGGQSHRNLDYKRTWMALREFTDKLLTKERSHRVK